ncbi:MAG TPA: ABC transporter substrate-binding protein, partial [Usitatibacter sp.]|nr:ABC transporter substrate-binding protein [Usitatibacter sp.]
MDPLRRSLVKALGAAGALGAAPRLVRANAPLPPPEVDTVRVVKFPSICQAPVFIAEELLRAEGFTGFTYVEAEAPGAGPGSVEVMNKGLADIASFFAAPLAIAIDRGADISVLGGMHPGCFELFTRPEIKSVKDLKGKTVSVLGNESGQHVFLASIVTYVGLDPARDIRWDFNPPEKGKQLLAEGKIDGYLGFPPDPQELRDRKVGRMLLSSTYDRPWSQYFCCMVAVNKTWRRKHPIATKRVMRAILKGGDICAADPDAGVRAFMARGFKPKLEYA